MGIPDSRPVADFLPTISLKAKDLAAEMTGLNVQSKDLKGQTKIEKEHIDNNLAVRNMLTQRGIVPENLPPGEDVKKLKRKLDGEEKKLMKDTKKKKMKCPLPFRTAAFDFDGSVLACCSSYDKEHDLGNINEESWKSIWNGPKYRSARRATS